MRSTDSWGVWVRVDWMWVLRVFVVRRPSPLLLPFLFSSLHFALTTYTLLPTHSAGAAGPLLMQRMSRSNRPSNATVTRKPSPVGWRNISSFSIRFVGQWARGAAPRWLAFWRWTRPSSMIPVHVLTASKTPKGGKDMSRRRMDRFGVFIVMKGDRPLGYVPKREPPTK